jgi:hypothetical protein
LRGEDVSDLAKYNLQIAACAAVQIAEPEAKADEPEPEPKPEPATKPTDGAEGNEPEAEPELPEVAQLHDIIEDLRAQLAAAQARTEDAAKQAKLIQSAKDKEVNDLKALLDAEKSGRETEKMSFGEEMQKMTRAADDLKAENQAIAVRLAKLTGGALALSPDGNPITTWAEAMAQCGGDYVLACKRYPDIRESVYRKANPHLQHKKG